MKPILLLYLIIFVPNLTGCSSKITDLKIPNLGDLPFIHRINIQQGNVITQDMLAQLEPEMEKKKVFLPHGLRMVTSFTKKISKTINAMVLAKSGMIMDRKNLKPTISMVNIME